MPSQFDAIIIGSGQAGPFLAERLARAGLATALIERDQLGGTCVNAGCMPTKTMIASARAAHVARRAAEYGVRSVGEVEVDLSVVRARKDAVVQASRANLERWLEGVENLTVIRGHARFTGPTSVLVEEQICRAPRIFINVGGRPVMPVWPGLDQVDYLTSSEIMELDEVPDHLVVVGGSYIGLEFAQMFRRFGAEVTVVEAADRLVPREDPDVSAGMQAILETEGVRFRLGARDLGFSPEGAGFVMHGEGPEGGFSLAGSHLLLAVGRRPNTEALGLDRAGVVVDARGFIPVDDQLRTNVPTIWALGDVNGRGAFTHTAFNDFEIVAANLLEGGLRRVSDRIPAYGVFTDPPLGRAGLNEAEALASGADVMVGRISMTRVGRARERGETQGFMKVLVDAASDRILGAAFLCIEGDEVVHTIIAAMAAGVSAEQLRRAVPVHPTVAELIPTLLSDLRPLAAQPPSAAAVPAYQTRRRLAG
jgi:pyruvate/2-oxoglutarate dehydrogenase complex dihydrolipoamide dehydrogenase (E3) component